MIRPEMAQKFIDQITDYTEYNINIMDESGVIIASRSKDRIGTYHEAADRIVRGKEDIVVVDDDKLYPGVLPERRCRRRHGQPISHTGSRHGDAAGNRSHAEI